MNAPPSVPCRGAIAAETAGRVIVFPRERCRVSSGKIRGGACHIVILPVVRIERWPEQKSTRKSATRNTKDERNKP